MTICTYRIAQFWPPCATQRFSDRARPVFCHLSALRLIPEYPALDDQLVDQGGDLFGGVRPGRRELGRNQAGHRWVIVV